MQSVTRFHLFKANADNGSEYFSNKMEIENVAEDLHKLETQTSFLVTSVLYDASRNLHFTVCAYRNHIFLGLFEKDNNRILFEDASSFLSHNINMRFDKLLYRAQMTIDGNINNEYLRQLQSAWLDTLPLLHAVILYENYIDKYEPQTRSNGTYDTVINTLVDTYETYREDGLTMEGLYLAIEGNVPSFKRAWELYTKGHNPELEVIDQKILLTYPKLAEQKEIFRKAYPEYADDHLYFGFSLDEESEFVLLDKDADIVAEVFISDNGQFELLSCLEEDIEVPTTEDGPEL